jgi:hypothetical protein
MPVSTENKESTGFPHFDEWLWSPTLEEEYPIAYQITFARLQQIAPSHPHGVGSYRDFGIPDEDTYYQILDSRKPDGRKEVGAIAENLREMQSKLDEDNRQHKQKMASQ